MKSSAIWEEKQNQAERGMLDQFTNCEGINDSIGGVTTDAKLRKAPAVDRPTKA
jgi:hypothetical protein